MLNEYNNNRIIYEMIKTIISNTLQEKHVHHKNEILLCS